MLITLEGIDGAGKSTLAKGLRDVLRARDAGEVRLLREPGGVPAAEAIRALVREPELTIGARAEALLFAAARAQLCEELLAPLLASGAIVLLDRFVDSSLAYQGVGRRLGGADVAAVNAFATGGLTPDRTLLLTLDPEVALTRSRARGTAADRIETAGAEFFARIADAYAALAAADPRRWRVIDAARPAEAVLAAALAALADLVPGISPDARA